MKLNIRHIIYTIAGILLSGALSSCADDQPIAEVTAGDIVLSVKSTGPNTRAVADDNNNENKISNVLFLFAREDASDDEPAVIYSKPGLSNTAEYTTSITFTREERENLFKAVTKGAKCRMYVLVNYAGDISKIKSIADAKALQVTSEFDKNQEQPNFVMEGEGEVEITDGDNYKGIGTVEVTRLASRFNLNVTVKKDGTDVDYITDVNGAKWYPVRSNIIVCINDAQKKAKISDKIETLATDPTGYFQTTPSYNTHTLLTVGADNVARHSLPIYTYMNKWDTYNPKNMTYFIVQLPWRKENETSYRYCYYQIPATTKGKIDRNFAYTINLNIGMLGSFDEAKPFEIEDLEYSIIPWNSIDIGAEMIDARYLVVNDPEISVYNDENISIPFFSTNDVTVESVDVSYDIFTFTDGTTTDSSTTPATLTYNLSTINNTESKSGIGSFASFTPTYENNSKNGTLEIFSSLNYWKPKNANGSSYTRTNYNNNVSINYFEKEANESAFSVKTIRIVLKHTQNTNVSPVTITVKQYPSMYISAHENTNTSGTTANTSSVFLNNQPGTNNNTLGGLTGSLSTSTNAKNPNMYLITVSRFLEGVSYQIGDPRESSSRLPYNTNLVNASKVDKDNKLTGTRGTLTYYYPTDVYKSNYVAPSFRVASAFGRLNQAFSTGTAYSSAEERCSVYQEEGYPAGRWRVPTKSESEYIIGLSNRNLIPPLFNGTTYYSAGGDNSSAKFVRCVYDTWYWGDTPQTSVHTFYWGDVKIN